MPPSRPPLKISKLDDIPIPRKFVKQPEPKTEFVPREVLFPTAAPLSIEAGAEPQVVAPNQVELNGTCPVHLLPAAHSLWMQLFSKSKVQPLNKVSDYMQQSPELAGVLSTYGLGAQPTLTIMGFMVMDAKDVNPELTRGSVGKETHIRWVPVMLDGEEVTVEVDPVRGPVWLSRDGYRGIAEQAGYFGSGECQRYGNKPWNEMSSTEREVLLISVARHHRQVIWEMAEQRQQEKEQRRNQKKK